MLSLRTYPGDSRGSFRRSCLFVCIAKQFTMLIKEKAMKESLMNRSRVLALVVITGVYAGLTGCATNGDIEALRSEIAQNKKDTATATAAATRDAADAKAIAQNAVTTANAAKATSDDTASKLDRMFKKAMYK
jgi:murein lipoprotein